MVRYLYAAANAPSTLRELVSRDYTDTGLTPPMQADSWVRASSTPYLCPREEVLAARASIPRTKRFSSADSRLIALHGTSLHWGVQNLLLPDSLVGRWKCSKCAACVGGYRFDESGPELHDRLLELASTNPAAYVEERDFALSNMIPRPLRCDECDAIHGDDDFPLFSYEEQWFADPYLRTGGHTDGLLVVPWRKSRGILEIKSIGNHLVWKIRHTPMVEHVFQSHVYMHVLNVDWAIILYWDKGSNGLECLVEHTIERDQSIIDEIVNSIASTREGIKGGALPTRICTDVECRRAQRCELRTKCFELTE